MSHRNPHGKLVLNHSARVAEQCAHIAAHYLDHFVPTHPRMTRHAFAEMLRKTAPAQRIDDPVLRKCVVDTVFNPYNRQLHALHGLSATLQQLQKNVEEMMLRNGHRAPRQ